MKRVPSLLSLAVVCVFAMPVLAQQGASRTVYISVLDRAGAPVTSLRPADVTVSEDNHARPVLAIERATQPPTIALIVDEHQLWSGTVRASVEAFSEHLPKGWQIGLFSAERPEMKIVDFTQDPSVLLKTIRNFTPVTPSHRDDQVHLEDLFQYLTTQFKKKETMRPVILMMGPQGRSPNWDLVVKDILRTRITVFIATANGPTNLAGTAAEMTGGRIELVLSEVGLAKALDKIVTDIDGELAVTYAAPDKPPKDGFRLRVKVTQPDVDTRAPDYVF